MLTLTAGVVDTVSYSVSASSIINQGKLHVIHKQYLSIYLKAYLQYNSIIHLYVCGIYKSII